MAQITASMVKDLRERTGAGMMDCKKALGETDGDIEAAIDWLRKKGLAAAAQRRPAASLPKGSSPWSSTAARGAVVEVNAETDFVARNEQFQEYVRTVGQGRAVGRRRRHRGPEGGALIRAVRRPWARP